MNFLLKHYSFVLLFAFAPLAGTAQLSIPGANGSDGEFAPTSSITIDLSQAATGVWDTDNSASAGKGVYDPEKWAVVFKYSSVRIPPGVTVNFKNNASRAPVVWLVSGDVEIHGTLSLMGNSSTPGPGGFRPGFDNVGSLPASAGFGPGGGPLEFGTGAYLDRGSQATGGQPYGNSQILPLIGGSGAANGGSGWGSGAGGGAILLAVQGELEVTGTITCDGAPAEGVFGGSGGGIRLVAGRLTGGGTLTAHGGGDYGRGFYGGFGRIRIETPSYAGDLRVTPPTQVVAPDSPLLLWPPATGPTARIVSVAGLNSPADPAAHLAPAPADITLQTTNTVEIVIETTNLDSTADVIARIVPIHGNDIRVKAAHTSGDRQLSRWTASTNFPPGYAAIQVRATGQ